MERESEGAEGESRREEKTGACLGISFLVPISPETVPPPWVVCPSPELFNNSGSKTYLCSMAGEYMKYSR